MSGMQTRYLLVLVWFIVLVGCSPTTAVTPTAATPTTVALVTDAHTATQTQIPTATITPTITNTPSVTPTPTDTSIPTSTPAVTATNIPDVLSEMPEYSQDATVIVAGTYVFEITATNVRTEIGTYIAPNDRTYLTFEGNLYNYGQQHTDFFRTDFELEMVTGERISPNILLMAALKEEAYPEREYPSRSSLRINTLGLATRQWTPIFLTYEVPLNYESVNLIFRPANIDPPSVVGLWIVQSDNMDTLTSYKAYQDGEPHYDLQFELSQNHEALEEIIDDEVITLDNCFGTEVLARSQSFEQVLEPSFEIGNMVQGAANFGIAALPDIIPFQDLLSNSVISSMMESEFVQNYSLSEDDSFTFTREETLQAAPGTMTNYRLTWYRVTVQGTLIMHIGSHNYYIPYTLTNRLRSELISLPPGDCSARESE